jgi:hypothetical protein
MLLFIKAYSYAMKKGVLMNLLMRILLPLSSMCMF